MPGGEPCRNSQGARERNKQGVYVVAVADGADERVFRAAPPRLLSRVVGHGAGDAIVEPAHLREQVGLAADNFSRQRAGLVVDVDEALFPEDTRKELRSRNGADGRGVERVIERQAFDGITEMHLDRSPYRHRDPALEDGISELGFPVDLP